MDIYTYVLYISSRFKYIYKVRYILLYNIIVQDISKIHEKKQFWSREKLVKRKLKILFT